MVDRTSTSKLIPFPRLLSDCSTGRALETDSTNEYPEQGASQSHLRHRGLHLMSPGTTAAAAAQESSQARTDRIVAQIEWEIEQQAARQREKHAFGFVVQQAKALSRIEIETPATIARRLFSALLSFARPA